jgi:hypothetical protein
MENIIDSSILECSDLSKQRSYDKKHAKQMVEKIKENGNLKYCGVNTYTFSVLDDEQVLEVLLKDDPDLFYELMITCPEFLVVVVRNCNIRRYDLEVLSKQQLEDIYLSYLYHDLGTTKRVPKEVITYEFCKKISQYFSVELFDIPLEYRSVEICNNIIFDDNKGDCFEYLPEEMKTLEVCKKIAASTGYISKFPEEFKTEEICLSASQTNPCSIYYMPEKYKTKEVCMNALRGGDYLEHVPEVLRTKEFYEEIVDINPCLLRSIPKEYKTKEMCLKAVKKDCNLLDHLIEDKLLEGTDVNVTNLVDQLIFEYDVIALKYIPDEMETKELYEKAVLKDSKALHYIPENLRTKELCQIALSKNLSAFKDVPNKLKDHLITPEMYMSAVRNNIQNFNVVPEKYKTLEMCNLVAKEYPYLIPDEFKTVEFLLDNDLLRQLFVDVNLVKYKLGFSYEKVHKENYECPVLLVSTKDNMYIQLACSHLFSKEAIDNLESNNCPLCRKIIRKTLIHVQ